MESKRIAYLSSEYPGISHTFIFREIQFLRSRGYDIVTSSINVPRHLERMTDDELADSKETYYIKSESIISVLATHIKFFLKKPLKYLHAIVLSFQYSHRSGRRYFKGLAYFIESILLLNWMNKNECHHIHIHFGNPAATVALIAKAFGTITFSLSIHGPDIFDNVKINILTEKINEAIAVRCISYYCQSQLMKLVSFDTWNKFTIVRCGISLDDFLPRPNNPNDKIEILCLGRLVPAKGQFILLEAMRKLYQRKIDFHLNLVGDGEDMETLKKLVNTIGLDHCVTFAGAVGQDEVHLYYDKADIFVLASFAEGIPVVLMEAMAKEVATVSTRITGIPELIEDGVDGLLVSPADTESLVNHIQLLIQDDEFRNQLGKNARNKIFKQYNISNNCIKMDSFFSGILSKSI